MSLTGILLGLINVAIVIAVLVLIGYIILWIMGMLGFPVPQMVQKMFVIIVALIALYMIVALLLGIPTLRIIHSQAPPVGGTVAAPPTILANGR